MARTVGNQRRVQLQRAPHVEALFGIIRLQPGITTGEVYARYAATPLRGDARHYTSRSVSNLLSVMWQDGAITGRLLNAGFGSTRVWRVASRDPTQREPAPIGPNPDYDPDDYWDGDEE